MRRQILSWSDVDALMEHLLPQFYGSFGALLMIARGGIIPGGLIAERLNLRYLLTAAVRFPADPPPESISPLGHLAPPSLTPETRSLKPELRSMPDFILFPPDAALRGRRTLVVQHVWNHGRTINTVAGRVVAADGSPELCVLHYKPANSIFPDLKPDYYAAITDDYIVYPWEVSHHLETYRPMLELA